MKKTHFYQISFLSILLLLFSSCEKTFIEEPLDDLSLKKATLTTGSDEYGYNWNAHQFVGYLINAWVGDNVDPTADWFKMEPFGGNLETYQLAHPEVVNFPFWIYGDMTLVMHWNEALISRDGIYSSNRIDTDAWITFHYKMGEGRDKWSQFQKFVAVKSSDVLVAYAMDEMNNVVFGEWFSDYGAGESVGYYYMWEGLALVQVVNTGNVPEGMLPTYKSPMGPGIGTYKLR